MGSQPWKAMLRRRVLNSRQYGDCQNFKIERKGVTYEGTVEFGTERNRPVLFVGGETVILDRATKIDGVPAPDWKENRDS